MDPFTLLIGGISAATSLFGMSEQASSGRQQRRLAREARRVTRRAEGVQQAIADENYQYSVQQSNASREQEAIRRQAFNISVARGQREIVRNAQQAGGAAAARAAAQGGLTSSGYQGTRAQLFNERASQLGDLATNANLGNRNFDINAGLLDYQTGMNARLSRYNTRLAGYQSSLNDINTRAGNIQSQAAQGQAMFQTGIQFLNAAPTIGNVAQSLFGSNSIGPWTTTVSG